VLVSGAGEHGRGRNVIATKFALSPGSVYNHLKKHISSEYRRALLAGPFGSEDELRELAAQEGHKHHAIGHNRGNDRGDLERRPTVHRNARVWSEF
jgi:hypothetical protein